VERSVCIHRAWCAGTSGLSRATRPNSGIAELARLELAGLEFAGLENDRLENDRVEQEETYILQTMK